MRQTTSILFASHVYVLRLCFIPSACCTAKRHSVPGFNRGTHRRHKASSWFGKGYGSRAVMVTGCIVRRIEGAVQLPRGRAGYATATCWTQSYLELQGSDILHNTMFTFDCPSSRGDKSHKMRKLLSISTSQWPRCRPLPNASGTTSLSRLLE
ncbi:hypothetical protein GE09DRAFT_281602 [Coniochaeta sp. 2T2.1]|nr:hypothetical protein GE09DRAFT_281602 [Coniochaeta sp. 2T2.1]